MENHEIIELKNSNLFFTLIIKDFSIFVGKSINFKDKINSPIIFF